MNLFPTTTRIAFTVFGTPQQRGSKVCAGIRGGGVMIVANGQAPTLTRIGKAFALRGGRPVIKDENTDDSRKWMKAVAQVAKSEMRDAEPITRPVVLTARFYFERPKCHFGTGRNAGIVKDSAPVHHGQSPDIAKLLRALEDAMSGIVYVDDRLIQGYGAGTGRYWCEPGKLERCEVEVEEQC